MRSLLLCLLMFLYFFLDSKQLKVSISMLWNPIVFHYSLYLISTFFFLPLFYISLFRTGRVYVQSQRYHLLLYDLLSRPLSTGDVLFTNFWFHLEFQCIKVHFTFWMAVQPLFFFFENVQPLHCSSMICIMQFWTLTYCGHLYRQVALRT